MNMPVALAARGILLGIMAAAAAAQLGLMALGKMAEMELIILVAEEAAAEGLAEVNLLLAERQQPQKAEWAAKVFGAMAVAMPELPELAPMPHLREPAVAAVTKVLMVDMGKEDLSGLA